MTYNDLLEIAVKEGIEIIGYDFTGDLKGLCVGDTIFLCNSLVTEKEKRIILAEELGHYYKNVGDILDPNNLHNSQQEIRGRRWGIEQLVKLEKIIEARHEGISNRFELAEYLNVTEQYLDESLRSYKSRFGKKVIVDGYILDLDTLEVMEVLAMDEMGLKSYIKEYKK